MAPKRLSRRELRQITAHALIPMAIRKLRNEKIANSQTSNRLADALEAALYNPTKAAEAFGIKRPRGRPRKEDAIVLREGHWISGLDIPTLRSLGLDQLTAKFLARALKKVLCDPAKADDALGIKRPRGRGNLYSERKDWEIASDIQLLRSWGFRLVASKTDRGVYERVAERHHCSIDEVKRAWRKHRNFIDMEDAYLAWLANGGSKE